MVLACSAPSRIHDARLVGKMLLFKYIVKLRAQFLHLIVFMYMCRGTDGDCVAFAYLRARFSQAPEKLYFFGNTQYTRDKKIIRT